MILKLNFEKNDLPLEGLRVLDLSSILAGPLTGSFFAELGAEVIKIENKLTNGDATRQWKLEKEDTESPISAYYCSANFGKDVRLLDYHVQADINDVEVLLANSDVVISNFQKKVAQKFKLDPESVAERYPNIIFAQLSAYKYDDPKPGYDLVMQGETGWISMNGSDSNHLAKLPVALIDIIAAHQMKEAILLALLKKMKTGKGSVVHISLFKSAISALANQASNYLMAGHVAKPLGTLHPNIAPYGDIFVSKDGQNLILAIGSDAQFKKLWFSLGIDEQYYHTFETNSERLSKRSEMQSILQGQIGKKGLVEIQQIFELNNLPYCLIKDMGRVFEDSLAQSMVKSTKIGDITAKSVSNVAFEFPSF
jgi:crotonobetainyl-CoA:carnitine CoA-transferase CaiB-like acyl-CoA transferase